jgi:putative ABC transport system permease protein
MNTATFFTLARKSLWNRRFSSLLTLFSVALSVALFVGIERLRVSAKESFTNTISKTQLIVGARGGSVSLLLYTVFRMGSATNNISFDSWQKYAKHPDVAWTIPLSLGDSYRGYRVVATNEDFYKHYRFRGDKTVSFSSGSLPNDVFHVGLGADVAETLKHKLADKIVLSHGVSSGKAIFDHGDKPFQVVGILERTNTPIDRSVYITLEGMEAIHMDWQSGVPPLPGEATPADSLSKENIKIEQITGFLVGTKSPIAVLGLQREISLDESEPLMAIMPGVALDELWRTVGYVETSLSLMGAFVVVVGLLSMLIALYSSVQERRREMAILRAVGAHPRSLVGLLVVESWLLGTAGVLLGVGFLYGLFYAVRPFVEAEFGLMLDIGGPRLYEIGLLAGVSLISLALGFVPAWRAYRNSLSDGLVAKV